MSSGRRPAASLRRGLAVASVGLAAALAALLGPLLPGLAALDLFAYDAWHQMAGERVVVRRVAIVAIDDRSLERFHDTPLAFWQPQLGAAIATLHQAGVRAIGIDLIQASSAENWLASIGAGDTPAGRSYEAPYRAALSGGGIVLAAARSGSPDMPDLMPPVEYQMLLPGGPDDLGLVNLEGDADGFIRSLRPVLAENVPGLSLAARLMLAAEGTAPTRENVAARFGADGGSARLLPFSGPPGSVPRVSLDSLLAADALQRADVQALRDRVVILAADSARLQEDLHLTPYARTLPGSQPRLMRGGEVHAQALEALLSGRTIRAVPPWLSVLAAALLGMAVALASRRFAPAGTALVVGGLALGGLTASLLLFLGDIWLAPMPLLLGLATAWACGLAARIGREAQERLRLRRIFARYVSDEVAELAVRDALPDVGGQTADVTVLFLDIRNFTVLSEKLDAHEVFELLNAWLPRACGPILAERGNVDKFIGDAVMAVFGAPLPLPDHARRAVQTAGEIARAAEEFAGWVAERFPGRDLPPFAIGIGLHSGPAVVGNLGTERRVEFTAIGDTVNVAARLESASKDLGWRIVASRATAAAAGLAPADEDVQMVALKGKAEKLAVVEIPWAITK